MSFNKVLVTGASGFTGSWVVKELLSRGINVRAMVRSVKSSKLTANSKLELVEADLSNPESLAPAVSGVDAVIHIAAIFRQAGLPDEAYYKVNVEGTRKLLELSEEFGVKRFIHCSTVGVHGHIANPPANENAPFSPGDIYQETKLAGEKVAREFFAQGRISGAVIRPAMIYGPGDQRTLKLFRMLSKKKFFYVGAGNQFVHFVDVRDLSRAFADLLQAQHLNNKVYIIAGSSPMPLKKFVAKVAAVLDVPEPWLHLPVKPLQIAGSICEAICTPLKISPPLYRRRVDFFTKNRHFDCSAALQDFGYKPAQDLVSEITDIINSYVEAGYISATKLSAPCKILRSMEGKIFAWDEMSQSFYGISPDEAIGKVTHDILETVFPIRLRDIEQNVKGQGYWLGNLSHRSSKGNNLEVLSHWQLDQNENVIEINRVRLNSNISAGKNLNCKMFTVAGFIESLMPELLDWASLISGSYLPAI